jgi:hypothetical protein
LGGRPPQNADAADIVEYPSVFYHDIRLEFDLGDQLGDPSSRYGSDFVVYLGVDNVLNRKPPLGATGAGAGGGGGAQDRPGSANSNGAIYDVRGRQFFLGVRAGF